MLQPEDSKCSNFKLLQNLYAKLERYIFPVLTDLEDGISLQMTTRQL